MKAHDFIAVIFPQDPGKAYFAEIRKVNSNNTFECRFVHSSSIYIFKMQPGWIEVVQTSGLFKAGTKTNQVTLFSPIEQQYLGKGGNASVSFDDGKVYLGRVEEMSPAMQIRFLHSGNIYSFDANQVAHHPGSPYDGRKALAIRAFDQGKSLFSEEKTMAISLSMVDGFNKQLSGEFGVILKRTDTDQILYQNDNLSAEDSTANDLLSVVINEGQNLIVLIDFHPAFNPYTANPISSSEIDRTTTISGSKTFTYKSTPEMHFSVKIQNDTSTVTATSSENAIRSKYSEVTSNSSTSVTPEAKLEGSVGIDLFGIVEIGGGGSIGGTSTVETGTGSTDGTGISHESGTETSRTWNVYYPMGLEIVPAL